jgi:hypothetical protein
LLPQVRRVRCEASGVMVPKDKAIKRFIVRNIVDASAIRDIQDSSVFDGEQQRRQQHRAAAARVVAAVEQAGRQQMGGSSWRCTGNSSKQADSSAGDPMQASGRWLRACAPGWPQHPSGGRDEPAAASSRAGVGMQLG